MRLSATCIFLWSTWGLGLPLTAVAQAVDELTVQAGRLAQRQLDAPASVSAIDAQTIREAGPQVNLSEALASVPGVVALNRNNYAQDVQISIRGFGARAAFGLRGIRLITDGIPATIPDGQGQASTVALTSADRIEVLTGPLAQLYGNSAGGVIQTFTREAGAQPEAQLNTTFGANGLRRHDALLSGRSGNVGLVADYSEFGTDGWRQHSAAQRKQFNGVLTSQLHDSTRLKIVVNAFDMPEAQDPMGLTAAQLTADPRQAGTNAVARNARKSVQHQQIGAVLEHHMDADQHLHLRAYFGTRENLQYQSGATWIGLDRDFSGLGLQWHGRTRPQAGGRVQWVVGLETDQSTERRQAGATSNGEKTGATTRDEINRASNRDVFAQAHWHLDPAVVPVTLTGGLRRSEVELRSQDSYLSDGQDGSGQVRYQATNPVLGATWHATNALNVYANWGKGFETPTLAEAAYVTNGSNTVVGQFNPNLLASRSRHKEVGLKWTPSNASRLQAALFHIGTDDEIVVLKSSFGSTAYKNASATTRQGAEVSWSQQWHGQWRSQLSAAWLQATYNKAFSSIIAGSNVSIPAGNRLPGIPEQQLFASLQWAQHGFVSKNRQGTPGWSSSLDWVVRSALWANDMNDEAARAPSFSVLNLKVRHRTELGRAQLETWAGIDNLSDRRTVGSVIVNQSSSQFFEPGLPRQWMLGLRVTAPL